MRHLDTRPAQMASKAEQALNRMIPTPTALGLTTAEKRLRRGHEKHCLKGWWILGTAVTTIVITDEAMKLQLVRASSDQTVSIIPMSLHSTIIHDETSRGLKFPPLMEPSGRTPVAAWIAAQP